MSIAIQFPLLAASVTSQPTTQPAASLADMILLFAAAVGLIVAWRLGAFRPRSIQRIPTHTPSPMSLLAVAFSGYFTAVIFVTLCQAIYLPPQPHSSTTRSATTAVAQSIEEDPLDKLPPRPHAMIEFGYSLAGMLAMLILLRLVKPRAAAAELGLSKSTLARAIPIAFAGAVVAIPWTFLATAASANAFVYFGQNPENHPILKQLQSTADPTVQWLLAFTAIVIAPISEELLFRGCLQTALRQMTCRPWPAVLISSLVFALVHPAAWMYAPLMFLAVCLGYIYNRTNNLWSTIIIHAAFNAISASIALQ